MVGMEKISEAILDKVKAEAEGIIVEAEKQARQTLAEAESQKAARWEEEKARVLQEAAESAARIEARSQAEARQELSKAKTEVINEIISGVKKKLGSVTADAGSLAGLIKEAVATLNVDKIRIYASPKDAAVVRKLVEKDKALATRVAEVKEQDLGGGVIVEDVNGKIRIDSTYDTRLEMLLPRLLPEVGKEIF